MTVRALVLAIVTPALLTPAVAAGADDPPATMSTVGGELLGRPGTQVHADDGVPELPEDLTAKSWIVADAENGEVLAAHNAHWPLPPASTIKMLFADTVLPKFDREDLYRARPEHFADLGPGSSAVGIADFQTYTVEDLWHGVFLASGNDAVYALTAMNGGKEQTVREMNERAEELQAGDTHVVNPDGYDAEGQVSSAYDLTLIARSGMQNADFREYAATPRADFPGEGEGEDRETYEIQSTNRLLVGAAGLESYEGIAGVKNGYTTAAGYTFTGVAERDGRVLLVTVMAPEGDGLTVYRETAALFDWGFEAADTVEPVGELVPPLSELPEEPAADGAGEDAGDDGQNADGDEPVSGAGAAGEGGSASGPAVLGVTAGGLVVLTAAAYVFHRRHPLPLPLTRQTRRREDAPVE
ncbi:D-alanyl-D-alanine carboxypeptidase family protein [Streptomyces litchfieldiae]|uniref:Serine hydrolase n=1 Tax=Streptomyces litchfieldiae TaxID=3075543 RepID=A0ABU2N0I2_9ACTN|nr:serine hydrolase [Streptomyces sp. DSM 44938]MDT0347251.1 serine hydrolase [Streptomyces sp. DSM 44938]